MSQPQPQNRQLRASATREEGARVTRQWTPPSLLPDPVRKPGLAYRWIRNALQGTSDYVYFNKAIREGWEPVRLSDYPELKLAASPRADAQDKDLVEVGGLILCTMPLEMTKQRDAHYSGIGRQQMAAEASRLSTINDPRMPMLKPAMRQEVEFGRGGRPDEIDE